MIYIKYSSECRWNAGFVSGKTAATLFRWMIKFEQTTKAHFVTESRKAQPEVPEGPNQSPDGGSETKLPENF